MRTLKESILSRSNHSGENFKAQRRKEIEDWLKEYNIRNYTINDDFTIDVNGDVYLVRKNLTEFPDYIQFGIVKGDFKCNDNKLISLKGTPREVYKSFSCSSNKLTSLEGAPERIYGDFYCNNNQLTDLKGISEYVTSVQCANNKLTSLKGAPENLIGDFYCSYNKLTSLEGAPRRVKGDFSCDENSVQFTNNEVKAVCTVEGSIYT